MARKSKFENDNSLKSASLIDAIIKKSEITPSDIENFQERYGISNQELSRLSGHAEAQISNWQNGKTEIPHRAKQHFALLFQHFAHYFNFQS